MIGRGDAIGDQLPVCVGECHLHREMDAGTRHNLALKRIAMQIDDTREAGAETLHQQFAHPAGISTDSGDSVPLNPNTRLNYSFARDQHPRSLNQRTQQTSPNTITMP